LPLHPAARTRAVNSTAVMKRGEPILDIQVFSIVTQFIIAI
jgi:hypothetical protein